MEKRSVTSPTLTHRQHVKQGERWGLHAYFVALMTLFFFFAHGKTVPSRERLLFLVMKIKAMPMRISTCAADVSTIAEAH